MISKSYSRHPIIATWTCLSSIQYTLFFIRTFNFGAEDGRSYLYSFLRFEAENVLKMFFNLHDMQYFKKTQGWEKYKVCLDKTSDCTVSPDTFEGVEVILEQV